MLGRSRGLWPAWTLVVAGALASLGACADDPVNLTLDDVDAGTDSGTKIDAPVLGPDGCATTCSDDHRRVLCEGKPVETCRDDETCHEGRCQSACSLAESGKSSVGCDYYSPLPDSVDSLWEGFSRGNCFAAFVVNTWSAPVEIQVDLQGEPLDASRFAYIPSGKGQSMTYTRLSDGKLPPGQVAILFLSVLPAAQIPCPAGTNAAIYSDPGRHGTGFGSAFHIKTSAPVVSYDIYPYGGGESAVTGATLLLPTSVWGTNYIAVAAHSSRPVTTFVAREDGTEVTIGPTVDIVGKGPVEGTPKGTPKTYYLDKGQFLQIAQDEELTGSPIQSNKPIGVWGGSTCLYLAQPYCDAAHQQIPPVGALGHEYVAVRYRDRFPGVPESPPWRLIGVVDGTELTYFPKAPAGAPTKLKSGQIAEFEEGEPFVVKSQDADHPFYMAGYMTGCRVVGTNDDCRGDPEFVNVVPPAQYLSKYTFFTDPTYPETHLVVIRRRGPSGFADVTLDCAGELTGWTALGDEYEWTRFDLVRGNFEAQGGCDNGRHEMTSDEPFGVTIWGWGSAATGGALQDASVPGFYTQCVSYAYPASAGVLKITDVVVPPIPK